MYENEKVCGGIAAKRDKSDIKIASERIGEKIHHTAHLIAVLGDRLESVLKPGGQPMAIVVGNAQGIERERERSPLDRSLTSHSDFIGDNNAKLQALIDSLSV